MWKLPINVEGGRKTSALKRNLEAVTVEQLQAELDA